VPIYGIKLGTDISEEFAIDRVTLISRAKLDRVRSRFGITATTWKRLSDTWIKERSPDANVFALLRDSSGKAEDELFRTVEEELLILHLIQLPLSEKSTLRAWSPDGTSLRTPDLGQEQK